MPFLHPHFWEREGSPTEIDHRQKVGTLILSFLLEDLGKRSGTLIPENRCPIRSPSISLPEWQFFFWVGELILFWVGPPQLGAPFTPLFWEREGSPTKITTGKK